jgi:glutamate-1-semialdehyde 2,1-aminomutase
VISDEVLNFRQDFRGASARYGLTPDLFALGKIIGGGLPVGAVGGRADVMRVFAADVTRAQLPQGGTFAANPMAMVAGRAAMQALDRAQFAHLERLGEQLRNGLRAAIEKTGAPFCVTGAASLFRIHTSRTPPREFRELHATPAAIRVLRELTRHFATHGIVLPNSAAACLSTPMTAAEMQLITDVFANFLERRAELIAELR